MRIRTKLAALAVAGSTAGLVVLVGTGGAARADSLAPAGIQGALVNGASHVCSGAPGSTTPQVGPGGSCTYQIGATSGWTGQGPFTVSVNGTTVESCADGASCSSGASPTDPVGFLTGLSAPGPIAANTPVTVTVPAGTNGFAAVGSATGTN